jgi:hypothetical protein
LWWSVLSRRDFLEVNGVGNCSERIECLLRDYEETGCKDLNRQLWVRNYESLY